MFSYSQAAARPQCWTLLDLTVGYSAKVNLSVALWNLQLFFYICITEGFKINRVVCVEPYLNSLRIKVFIRQPFSGRCVGDIDCENKYCHSQIVKQILLGTEVLNSKMVYFVKIKTKWLSKKFSIKDVSLKTCRRRIEKCYYDFCWMKTWCSGPWFKVSLSSSIK